MLIAVLVVQDGGVDIAADNGINGGVDNTSIWRWFWWCHVVVVVHYAWC